MRLMWDVKTLMPTLRVVIAVSAGILCSCGPLTDAPMVSSAGAGGLAAASQTPGGSGVTVRYRVDHGGVPGQAATVTLDFSAVGLSLSTVRFTFDAGLLLTNTLPSTVVLLPGPSRMVLQVVPQTEGLFYLNVFTTHGEVTSVTSVPVRTDHAVPQLNHLGDVKVQGNGNRIIAIPVP
jgi:hypothetical protein